MSENRLFRCRRWWLASWYTGIMGVILSLCGLGVYEAIVRAHRVNIDSEVKSVAGTLHDSLEPVLKQPGQLTPVAQEVLPNLCLKAIHCPIQRTDLERHRVSEIRKDSYYLR